MTRIDEPLTAREMALITLFRGLTRNEQDQILFEIEKEHKNGNTI